MANKLVIFDCDGTLVDSQHAIHAAMEHAFGGLGLVTPTRAEVLKVVGLSLPEAFAVLAPDLTDAERIELSLRYKGAFPAAGLAEIERDPLFPGCKSVIEALAGRSDVTLGIATGKSQRGVRRLFDQEGWHSLFATIQTADEHPSKPHPSMINTAIAETDADPKSTVMIGDTSFDIAMGLNAGVHTIGVAWGYHAVEELTDAGAHAIVDEFMGLERMIDRLLESHR